MNPAVKVALNALIARQNLTASAMRDAIAAVMNGECSDVEIAALLTALRVKGEVDAEVVGAAQAMQACATPIATRQTGLLDTCGTGGDQLHTFNISTAAALVAAAAGVPVAKHGNRSVSSSSGSADVLEALGVNIQIPPEGVTRCLDDLGIGFCFAPLLHGAMKHAGPIRKQLGFRTIFNLLGPLTNPASAEYQLLGASRTETAALLARALSQLGRKHAFVVCGNDELDEVSLWGETVAFEVSGTDIREHRWTAAEFGLPECTPSELKVDSAAASAQVIQDILKGTPGPARNMVVANAATALFAAERESDLKSAVNVIQATLDSGAASRLLENLKWLSGQK